MGEDLTKINMTMNARKINSMIIARYSRRYEIKVGGEKVEQVQGY